jgi:hypothetical protein
LPKGYWTLAVNGDLVKESGVGKVVSGIMDMKETEMCVLFEKQ